MSCGANVSDPTGLAGKTIEIGCGPDEVSRCWHDARHDSRYEDCDLPITHVDRAPNRGSPVGPAGCGRRPVYRYAWPHAAACIQHDLKPAVPIFDDRGAAFDPIAGVGCDRRSTSARVAGRSPRVDRFSLPMI